MPGALPYEDALNAIVAALGRAGVPIDDLDRKLTEKWRFGGYRILWPRTHYPTAWGFGPDEHFIARLNLPGKPWAVFDRKEDGEYRVVTYDTKADALAGRSYFGQKKYDPQPWHDAGYRYLNEQRSHWYMVQRKKGYKPSHNDEAAQDLLGMMHAALNETPSPESEEKFKSRKAMYLDLIAPPKAPRKAATRRGLGEADPASNFLHVFKQRDAVNRFDYGHQIQAGAAEEVAWELGYENEPYAKTLAPYEDWARTIGADLKKAWGEGRAAAGGGAAGWGDLISFVSFWIPIGAYVEYADTGFEKERGAAGVEKGWFVRQMIPGEPERYAVAWTANGVIKGKGGTAISGNRRDPMTDRDAVLRAIRWGTRQEADAEIREAH